MRTFIAVPFDDQLTRIYQRLYDEGRAAYPRLRWVHPGNLHLTLRFLGDTAPDLVEPLRLEVEAVVGSEAPFSFTIGGPGQFSAGGGAAPRVLWFGVDEGRSGLERLARGIEKAARRCGFPRERRPWRPHLTVARNTRRSPQSLADSDWKRLGSECGLAGLSVTVDNVWLLESDLRPEGPRYSAVWKTPLGASERPENDDKDEGAPA